MLTTVGRTVPHDGRLAAYGAQGTGWGGSARSGRRPSPSTVGATEPPDRGRTPPTPAPTHHTPPARATPPPPPPAPPPPPPARTGPPRASGGGGNGAPSHNGPARAAAG